MKENRKMSLCVAGDGLSSRVGMEIKTLPLRSESCSLWLRRASRWSVMDFRYGVG